MRNTALLPKAPEGYELVLCTSCHQPIQMRSGRMLTCACGALPPSVPFGVRACPDVRADAAALACIQRNDRRTRS